MHRHVFFSVSGSKSGSFSLEVERPARSATCSYMLLVVSFHDLEFSFRFLDYSSRLWSFGISSRPGRHLAKLSRTVRTIFYSNMRSSIF